MLEVELDDPSEVPTLPATVSGRVVREVTDEIAYTNYSLALALSEGI